MGKVLVWICWPWHSGCGAEAQFTFSHAWATSVMVSVVTQNKGNNEFHPIGRPRKNSIRGATERIMPNYLTLFGFTDIL